MTGIIRKKNPGDAWETVVDDGGSGSGSVSEITSTDNSVTITDPTGPTVDLSVNGGSQPGAVRRLDLGVITAADLVAGPVTLYEPDAGEVVGPVYLYAIEFLVLGGKAIIISRDEQVDPDDTSGFPALAAWDSDLARDGGTWPASADEAFGTPLTTGVVKAALSESYLALPSGEPWQANHVYPTALIVASNHAWEGNGGTSGGSLPDFAGNFGGSVVDNDITWFDLGDLTTADGSAHVYADVTTPVAP